MCRSSPRQPRFCYLTLMMYELPARLAASIFCCTPHALHANSVEWGKATSVMGDLQVVTHKWHWYGWQTVNRGNTATNYRCQSL